jgi:uncharacterized protein involved in type VI secretion and phage assembly
MMDEGLIMDVVERVRGRFFGKYRGVVTDVDASTMRIKAQVPAVLPDVKTGWCMACVPYAGPNVGMVMLPEVGSGVWIEFEGGDVSYPIWVGCFWHSGEVPSDASATVKSIETTAGKLQFDTDAGSVTVTDGQDQAVFSNGIQLTGGSGSLTLDSSGANVNNGNLSVQP